MAKVASNSFAWRVFGFFSLWTNLSKGKRSNVSSTKVMNGFFDNLPAKFQLDEAENEGKSHIQRLKMDMQWQCWVVLNLAEKMKKNDGGKVGFLGLFEATKIKG